MKKLLTSAILTTLAALSASAQIFFSVSGNGLEAPSYLYGTHHLAPLSSLTSNEKAMNALASADASVTEMDMTQNMMAIQTAMLPFIEAPQDSTLSKVLPPEIYAKTDSLMTTYARTPLSVLENTRPAFVATNLSVIFTMLSLPDFNPAEQLDTYVANYSKNAGHKTLALETVEQQCELLFKGISIDRQAAELAEMVSDTEKTIANMQRMNDAYLRHDLNDLFSLMEEDESDSLPIILDRRNQNWLAQLPDMFKEGSLFIAVGAAHLAGENGLVEGLRRLGYNVEAIN